jgi:hypothetical protein
MPNYVVGVHGYPPQQIGEAATQGYGHAVQHQVGATGGQVQQVRGLGHRMVYHTPYMVPADRAPDSFYTSGYAQGFPWSTFGGLTNPSCAISMQQALFQMQANGTLAGDMISWTRGFQTGASGAPA